MEPRTILTWAVLPCCQTHKRRFTSCEKPDEASAAFAPNPPALPVERTFHQRLTRRCYYGQQFGWKKGQAMPMDDLGSYQIFQQNGADIGAVMSAERHAIGVAVLFRR